MSDETKLTDRFSIRPDTWNEGRYFLVGGPTIGAPLGTLADVAALGRALVAFAEGAAYEVDAARYRRLRVLGAVPSTSPNLEAGTVLCFTSLDAFVDADIAAHPSRGEAKETADV